VHGVSRETLDHDRQNLQSAHAALAQAEGSLAATHAAIFGTTPATHPRVLAAEAALRTAWLNHSRTHILSPVSGYIVRRAVQLGQQVTPGTELLAIVPVDSVWVDANFKETQLAKLRIGQPVSVEADMYGSHVSFQGHVLGLSVGTGSALAVLPAQNASGNWIKIVQRLPVRIGLDAKQLAAHPLFVGLSTTVKVDAHDQSGATLSEHAVWDARLSTPVYATQDIGADAQIERILQANLATPASPMLARTSGQGDGS
jgi:membrane fusion protein, multidrug efflux system